MTKIALFSLLWVTSAVAADVDFSAVLTDQDDKPVIDCAGKPEECPDKNPLTLGKVALRVLTAPFDDERNISGEEKFKRGQLAMRVHNGGVVTLQAEDVALIKRLVAKGYGPLIVYRAWPLLDPATGK